MKEIFEKIKEKFKITSRSGNVDENVSRENILRSPKAVIAIVHSGSAVVSAQYPGKNLGNRHAKLWAMFLPQKLY